MSVHARSQRFAQAAFPLAQGKNDEYASFARKFPALIHSCGLAQAVAFALAKKQFEYAGGLAEVLQALGHAKFDEQRPSKEQLQSWKGDPVILVSAASLDKRSRESQLSDYLRLSRDAIQAADWLKRYVEAVGGDE